MNTQVTRNNVGSGATTEAVSHAFKKAGPARKPRAAARSKSLSTGSAKPAAKSKKHQLVALLSKPNGARISVIAERLGWQPHTVRAALSGLRKEGVMIEVSKSPKTGETVYATVAPAVREGGKTGSEASS